MSLVERIFAVDVLRGVAVLGILLINIEDFGLPHADKSAPGTEWVGAFLPSDLSRHDVLLWVLVRALFEGKMRAIFSMLFGAGVVLLTSHLDKRGEGARSADIYYRRTLWLLGFGLLHAYLLWEGDILFSYALSGLFLFPFRNASPRLLLALGAIVLSISIPRAAVIAMHRQDLRTQTALAKADEAAGRTPSRREKDARDEWTEILDGFEPNPRNVEESRDDHRGSYAHMFTERAELVMDVESTDYYSWAFFDTVGMMLIGMGLLKLGVLTASRPAAVYVGMAALGLGVGLPCSAAGAYELYVHRFDPVGVAWVTAAYEPGRLLVALAYIGVVMRVVRSGRLRRITSALAQVGRMALTNYLLTTLLCTTLFNGYGLGLFGTLGRGALYGVVLGVWCVELAASTLWLRSFRFGPTEWVWRSLTYWKLQPLRRAEA
ncbi:MAG TPA: DUF418 domain-containing protein [Polyangiaceae bacterium]